MKMHFLAGGRLKMRRSIYYPGAAREETVELPVTSTLLKHDQGNVLFDTGCHPEAATDPEARWGGMAKVMNPIFSPEDTVVAQLPKAGLSADDIDLVICSHLHSDHCGCNVFFRRATILCHAAELAAAQAEGAEKMGYLPVDWNQPQGITTFEGERDVFGDGRIVLLPMPGHTPGSIVARVALDTDGAFLLAADAAPIQACLDEGYAPRNSWDVAATEQSLVQIKAIAAEGVTVIFGHDDAQHRTLRSGGEFYA